MKTTFIKKAVILLTVRVFEEHLKEICGVFLVKATNLSVFCYRKSTPSGIYPSNFDVR